MDSKEFISSKDLISQARRAGFNFGKGDPVNRLRYYTKLGLFPHAVRKQEHAGEQFTVGFYPAYSLDLLAKIALLKKSGLRGFRLIEKAKVEFVRARVAQVEKESQTLGISPPLPLWKPSLAIATTLVSLLLVAAATVGVVQIAIKTDPRLTGDSKTSQEIDRGLVLAQEAPVFPGSLIAAVTPNLLVNGSFEAGSLGSLPKGWAYISDSASSNTKVSADSIRSGTLALLFEDKEGQGSIPLGISQATTTTTNGRAYTFGLWVRTFGLLRSTTLRVGLFGISDPSSPDLYHDFTLSPVATPYSDWTYYHYTFENLPKNKYPLIQILNYPGGKIFVDDVTLTEQSTAHVGLQSSNPYALTPGLNVNRLGDGSIVADSSANLYPASAALGGGGLGTSDKKFGQLYLSKATIDASGNLTTDGDATIKGTLTVDKDALVKGGFKAEKDSTISGKLTVTGDVTAPNIGVSGYWQRNSGAVSPTNITDDVLIGATATASAKIVFLNIASGTPTASVAGNLTFDSAGIIQSTKNQTLTIGGNSTGNIILSPNNTTLLTLTSTDLALNNLPILNIGNAGTDFTTSGGLTLAGDLTITGNDLVMGTNTSGFILVADGTDFNPVDASGDVDISSTGAVTIQTNSVALTTDTTGNYVATITAGSGISGSSSTEGGTPTIALGALTADWDQTGAFDISLNNTSSELKILEAGATPTLFGIFDIADLSTSDKTYTFPDVTGTVITTGDTGTVTSLMIAANVVGMADLARGTNGQIIVANTSADSAYVSLSGDATLSASGALTIAADSVALATDTTGNYVASVTTSALTGLTGGNTAAENTTSALAFDYSATLAANPALAASACVFATTGLICEGVTADLIETLLTFADPTSADKTITFPDLTGTVILSGHTFTGDVTATLGSANTTALTIAADSVALTTDTTGNYVATITAGSGISGTSSTEGGTPTIALAALTADWDQTGAFDISLNNASSELKILESAGATYFAIFDAGDLSADATVTISGSSSLNQNLLTTSSPTFVDLTLSGDIAVNGADVTTTATTFNLVNATATTINFAGAATTLSVGAGTGTTTVNNGLTITGALTANGASTFNTDVDLTLASTENLVISNTTQGATDLVAISPTWTGDNTADALGITTTYNVSASTSTVYGLNLTNADNTTSTGVIDALALFSNDQATETLADGVIIRHNVGSGTLTDALQIENTTAGGTITNAINILETAGTITTGINLGSGLTTDISFADTTPIVSFGNTGTLAFTDATNTLFSLVDQGAFATIRLTDKGSTGDPSTCSVGDIYFNDTDDVFKGCTAANTWEQLDNAAAGSSWSGITDPTAGLTLAMAANTTTFNWTDFTGNSNFFNFNFDNNGGTAGTDQGVLISNAVSTATTGDLNTEALLVLDQADTTTTGTTIVDDALLITNSGGSTLTDAIQIGTGTQAIGTGIRFGSTGITTDIVLQNAETIDNNTDGQIAFSGILTGSSGTNTRLQATGTGTGSTGTASIYFLNSSGTTRGRFETTATDTLSSGDGSDGSVTISSSTNCTTADISTADGDTTADCVATGITAAAAAGATTITVGSCTGLTANDEVLIAQMITSGSGTAGSYEFRTVSSCSGTTLTVSSATTNAYGASNAQVARVPQYTTVTVTGTGTLTASAWGGTTGGILTFRASTSVTVNSGGIIDANSLGFGGSSGGSAGSGGGDRASGTAGTAGSAGTGPGGGGGGSIGGNAGHAAGNCCVGGAGAGGTGGGGAGGAYATANAGSNGVSGAGGAGGNGSAASGGAGTGGSAGSTLGSASLSTIFLGSGGGGGAGGHGGGGGNGTDATQPAGSGGGGGAGGSGSVGGGIIYISTPTLTNNGTIRANGSNGSGGSSGSAGGSDDNAGGGGGGGGAGGGGGSGGSIYIATNDVTEGTMTASGGTGGTGGNGGNGGSTGVGGGGGAGTTGGSGGTGSPAGSAGTNAAPGSGGTGGDGRIRCDSNAGTACVTTPTANQNAISGSGYGTFYLGTTNTTASDLAEYYVAGDPSIAAGDVVTINSSQLTVNNEKGETETITTKGVLRKADKAYDSKLLGIISTNPGVVLGSIDGDTGKEDKRMLALAGRVPVKIAPDSEVIEVGDFLTSSSSSGLAMKATKAGYTVGKALENWSCADSSTIGGVYPATPEVSLDSNCKDKIEAFVHLSYNMGPIELALADVGVDVSGKVSQLSEISGQIASLAVEMASISGRLAKVEDSHPELVSGSLTNASGSAQTNWETLNQVQRDISVATLSAQFATFSDSLKVIGPSASSGPALFVAGQTQLGPTTIGGTLTVGLLHFDDLKAEISALNGELSFQNGVMRLTGQMGQMGQAGKVEINGDLAVLGDATVSGVMRTKGVVLEDTITGKVFCVQISQGEIVKKEGGCQN